MPFKLLNSKIRLESKHRWGIFHHLKQGFKILLSVSVSLSFLPSAPAEDAPQLGHTVCGGAGPGGWPGGRAGGCCLQAQLNHDVSGTPAVCSCRVVPAGFAGAVGSITSLLASPPVPALGPGGWGEAPAQELPG